MKLLSKKQLKHINTLVSKLHIDKETKVAMVQGFTNSRETSTTKLFVEEASDMIKHLKSLDPEEASAEKQRRYIIAMAHELRWELPNGKADMKRIDNWCKQYGGKQKELNSYTLQELPNLVTGFQKMYLSVLKKI